MKGRKPVPASVVDYDNHRTKEQLEAREAGEPKGCSAFLIPPKELSKVALKEWKRVVALYGELDSDIINDLDLGILACYCEARALYIEAETQMKSSTLLIFDEKGNPVENPLLKIMDKQGANIAKYGEQLCLSPVGRARMGMANSKKEVESDPLEALLKTGKNG